MRQALLERHFPDKDLGSQPVDGILTSLAASFIIIEGEQYPAFWPNCLDNEPLLLFTHGAAHQGYDIPSAALPHLEYREESFHYDEAFSGMLPRTVGYLLKAGQLEYDCRYSTMHGMSVTGGRGFRGLKSL
jgi:hypothetical protein